MKKSVKRKTVKRKTVKRKTVKRKTVKKTNGGNMSRERAATIIQRQSRKNTGECPICLESLKNDRTTTKCGHTFHKKCIEQALKRNGKCPMCRQQLVKQPKRTFGNIPLSMQ
jgi:hypothetical protein